MEGSGHDQPATMVVDIGRQGAAVDRVDRSTGADSRQRVDSRQQLTAVDSGQAWSLSTRG